MNISISWELSKIYGDNLKPYHLPVFTSADFWFFCVSECLYYALGGYSYLSIFNLDEKLDSKSYIDSFKILFKAIDAGLGNFEVYKDIIIIKSVPKFKTNLDGQIHCDNGPALKNINGEYEYYYENVEVSEKIILQPKLITISDIRNEKNRSVRNVMIERYGSEKFLNDLKYEIIDSCSNEDGENQLLKVKLNFHKTGKVDEEIAMKIIPEIFDLSPRGIIENLNLRRSIYLNTAAYGHFGREHEDFTWEKTDKADLIRNYLVN